MARRTGRVLAAVLVLASLVIPMSGQPASAASPRTIIGRQLIGHSVDGRPIVAYHLGDPTAAITAVVVGQMHGDEHAGVHVARAIIGGRPVAGIDLWVIPTMNPDGNTANTRQNAHGVDLNRNWPTRWAHLTGMFYSGPRPLSEPETRAVERFLTKVRPDLLVSIHQPLDGVDTTDGGRRDPAFRRELARNLHLPSKPFRCHSVCHGSMTHWVTTHQKGAAITVEFGYSPTTYALTVRAPRGIIRAFGGHYVRGT